MPKVMLIEDDATMLSLLKTLMQMEGYSVAASDGAGGVAAILEIIQQENPDLVLLDVHLRQASGFDVIRAIRTQPGLEGLVVLMSSGMELGIESRQAGADGFILKPYMPDELIERIKSKLPLSDN